MSLVVVSLLVVVVIVTRCYYANIELLNCMVHASFNRIVASLYKARERETESERETRHTLLLLKLLLLPHHYGHLCCINYSVYLLSLA